MRGVVQLVITPYSQQGAAGSSLVASAILPRSWAASLPDLTRVDQCGAGGLGNAGRSGGGRSQAAAEHPD
jgi:hypothetical protein